jgi:phage tail sheath gpL-like
MASLIAQIYSGRSTDTLTSTFETAGGNHSIAQRLTNYIDSLQTGGELAQSSSIPPSIALSIQENCVQASGTLTFVSVIATDAFVINGVTFTCVASGATGNQFNVGASDTLTAAAAAAAINASATALISGYVTASSALGVLTITSAFYGLSGNQCTLVSNDATITASGARLTAGAADATAQTISF